MTSSSTSPSTAPTATAPAASSSTGGVDTIAADRRIRDHFDGFAPEYHSAAFSGAGMGHLSSLDLAVVRRAATLAAIATARPKACDVGVGTGRISSELLRLGFELVGVDASEGMLAQAAPVLPGATLRHGSLAEQLPVDDNDVDLVTCMRVVKYLPDWRGAIGELTRVARPGAIVCFDLANAHSPARVGYPKDMVWPSTFREATAAIDAAGLDLLEMRPGVHVPDPVWRIARTDRAASLVRAGETVAATALGRHGARSWTFVCRKRGAHDRATAPLR